jgi:hypothetical protein
VLSQEGDMKSEIMDDEYEPYILLKISEKTLRKAGYDLLLYEGRWQPSGVTDLWVRVDAENPSIRQQRNVHVAHKKHISSKDKQVSWNADHSRHDLKSFDTKFTGIEKAKVVARAALGLSADAIFEGSSAKSISIIVESYLSSSSPLPKSTVYLEERARR